MPDYIETTVEKWLIDNKLNDILVSSRYPNEKMVYCSDAIKEFAKMLIGQTIENCAAHSDSEIDKEGAKVNTYRQFSLC